MKFKTKSCWIVCLLLITSSTLLFNSCEEDLPFEEQPGSTKIKRVSFSTFGNRVAGQAALKKMSKYLDTNGNGRNTSLQKSDSIAPSPTIITDEVILVEENGLSFYTFKMLTPGVTDRFSNLIVHLDSLDNITRTQVYEYKPDDTWMADISQPYHGTLRVYDNAIIPMDSVFEKSSGLCPTASGRWKCGADNNHSPDTPSPPCFSRNFEFIISVSYGPCPGEPVDEVIVDPDIGNNGGGGMTPRNGGTHGDHYSMRLHVKAKAVAALRLE